MVMTAPSGVRTELVFRRACGSGARRAQPAAGLAPSMISTSSSPTPPITDVHVLVDVPRAVAHAAARDEHPAVRQRRGRRVPAALEHPPVEHPGLGPGVEGVDRVEAVE